MRFAFEDFELDDETFELKQGGERVAMEPQVFDVLRHLVHHRDRVVAKAELLDEVWGDQFVSESALSTRIKQARQAVGDDGKAQRVIATSHGRGFRFVAPVVVDPASRSTEVGVAPDHDDRPDGRSPSRPEPTEILGRDEDAAAIRARLENRRLVTLVGVGGIGKTHLLHHLGAELAPRFDAGAVVVELAPVRTDRAVAAALLEAIGGGDSPGAEPFEAALAWLEEREVLLLIDNAEHVAREVADVCRAILRRCADVRILVTSRERLNVVGESVHPVGPLGGEATVALFVERAWDGGVDIEPQRTDVHELCERLDGVPLAVEIMAARAPLLSVADLSADLERHLAAVYRAGHDHHETLEATLRWSFDGLAEQERRLLEDLTVFAGSFDLAAAEVVSGLDPCLDPLLELCHRSLLVPSPGPSTSRFRLLEPIRLFAASSNVAIDDARDRHARHYLAEAIQADRLMASPEIDEGLARLRTEWPNVRAAFGRFEATGEIDAMAELVNATANYAEARLLTEVHRWAERAHRAALDAGVTPDPVLAANVARFSVHHGQLERMSELLDPIDRDHPSPHVRMAFIGRDWYVGRADDVFELLDRTLDEVRGEGGYWELTFTLLRVMSAQAVGDRLTELLDRLDGRLADDRPTAEFFQRTAEALRLQWDGRLTEAIVAFDEALARAEALGAAGFGLVANSLRTRAYRSLGDPAQAAALVGPSIRAAVESGGWSLAADSLVTAAIILADGGRADVAAQILAARRRAGYRFAGNAEAAFRKRLTEELGQAAYAANNEVGEQMGLAAAIDRAESELADLATLATTGENARTGPGE